MKLEDLNELLDKLPGGQNSMEEWNEKEWI